MDHFILKIKTSHHRKFRCFPYFSTLVSIFKVLRPTISFSNFKQFCPSFPFQELYQMPSCVSLYFGRSKLNVSTFSFPFEISRHFFTEMSHHGNGFRSVAFILRHKLTIWNLWHLSISFLKFLAISFTFPIIEMVSNVLIFIFVRSSLSLQNLSFPCQVARDFKSYHITEVVTGRQDFAW